MPRKLELSTVLNAMDRKDREFFKNLSPELRKEVQPYVLLRFMSAVKGSPDLQEYYLRTADRVNEHLFDLPSGHEELQWLLLTTISPGMGSKYHEWIPASKGGKDKVRAALEEIFPDCGDMEIDTLLVVNSDDDIRELLRDRGWDNKRIKSVF